MTNDHDHDHDLLCSVNDLGEDCNVVAIAMGSILLCP